MNFLKGPGAYEIRDFKEPEKKYMSSAVFVSSTGRWLNNSNSKTLPGPANYSPSKITKQSFHCELFLSFLFIISLNSNCLIFIDNNDRKWI